MQRSVRVGDYFANDDNGVWSWYLTNIRNGDFEEFSKNKLKTTLLKRFLNKRFDPANNQHHQPNTKILFISIPDKVHRDTVLLENFLRDYFHLERLEHIQITKLTQGKVYNHENHYILVDTLNNFEDPSFLKLVNTRWPQHDLGAREIRNSNNSSHNNNRNNNSNNSNNYNDNKDNTNTNTNGHGHGLYVGDSDERKVRAAKMYGTISERTDSSRSLSSLQSYAGHIDNGGPRYDNANSGRMQKVEVKSILSDSVNENTDDCSDRFFNDGNEKDQSSPGDDDDEVEVESIVLDFPHSAMRKQPSSQQAANILYSPAHSESVSLDSYNDSIDDGSQSSSQVTDYPGQPLTLTVTRRESDRLVSSQGEQEPGSAPEPAPEYDCVSELSSVSRSLHSLGSTTSLEDDGTDDDDNSDYSILSILPSISISDSLGHFRLVLQSSLVQNPDTKEIFTAIRQSNNEPSVADVEDDWLLYDSNFSMDNLQMLTLQDFLDTNRLFPKIIFYSMIVISDDESSQGTRPQHLTVGNELFAPSQNTLIRDPTRNDHISDNDSEVSYSNEPKQFYPRSDQDDNDNDYDYDDLSLSEKSDPRMYAPTRVQSNATNATAHRSIRTVNSIGDWAFLHEETQTSQKNDGTDKPQQREANVHFEKDANGLHLSTVHSTLRGGLSKVNTITSMGSVERSKSTPLPIILKSLSMDNEGKRWKTRMESFRHKRSHRSKNGEKSCVIM